MNPARKLVAAWDIPTKTDDIGDLAIQTDQTTQTNQLVVNTNGSEWSPIVTTPPRMSYATDVLQLLVSSGEAKTKLEPLIRDIIAQVIEEKQKEQPMFEL
jgi:hypothetical protein